MRRAEEFLGELGGVVAAVLLSLYSAPLAKRLSKVKGRVSELGPTLTSPSPSRSGARPNRARRGGAMPACRTTRHVACRALQHAAYSQHQAARQPPRVLTARARARVETRRTRGLAQGREIRYWISRGSFAGPSRALMARFDEAAPKVIIIGAGVAGLACFEKLLADGVAREDEILILESAIVRSAEWPPRGSRACRSTWAPRGFTGLTAIRSPRERRPCR